MSTDDEPMESVDDFRARARAWFPEHMPPRLPEPPERDDESRREVERELQRRLWDGGFAGICFPKEYGGLGLTPAHQAAFTEESLPYDMPYSLNVPTLGILAATLVDLGNHEQKAAHLPAILRGEELWVQFLSEPSGGSDLAGCRMSATQDGEEFVLNGSKIWSSAAYASDYAMCLARTNWDAPKHRGLTMFIVKIHQPGIQIDRIAQVDGSLEFCQEYFDDVRVPASDVIGEVNQGWAAANHLLNHERAAVGGGSKYVSGRSMGMHRGEPGTDAAVLARSVGRADDPNVRRLVARYRVAEVVNAQLVARVIQGLHSGTMPPAAGSLMKLSGATTAMATAELGLEIGGVNAVTWPVDGDDGVARGLGEYTLYRQGLSLGGGSNEMQRNLISERLLGMPREATGDRDMPYRDVPHAGRG
jgi:alkylation response protein AidB-like acyl-CoA dehydrogenase